jgi:hypothetical protein
MSQHEDTERAGGSEKVSYHVLWGKPGTVLGLVRMRLTPKELHSEFYWPGQGWVKDARAMDAWINGQDYEVIDEAEALRLAAAMEGDGPKA